MKIEYATSRPGVRSVDAASWMLPLIGIASLLLGLSISNQSLWIDEGLTAWLASQHGLSGLFHALRVVSETTTQPLEPVYHLYTWEWVKVFGVSEFALRASNIPFAILLVSALAWSSLNLFGVRFAWIVFALSPFLAVYMNEARPYIPLMASVTLSLVALLAYFDNPDKPVKTSCLRTVPPHDLLRIQRPII